MKNGSYISIISMINKFDGILQNFACFMFDLSEYKVKSKQMGVFRISCLDCLHRTNQFMECLAL